MRVPLRASAPFDRRRANAREYSGRSADAPAGFHVTVREKRLGVGEADFGRARAALFSWGVQRGSGFVPVETLPREPVPGVVSVFRIPFGPLRPLVVCRVFERVDTPRKASFAHVALEGHPQSGWESFEVELEDDGTVVARIRVVARPAVWWMRVAGPFANVALDVLLRRNLIALARAVAPRRVPS